MVNVGLYAESSGCTFSFPVEPGTWSVELLRALDWKCFHELVATLLSRAGLRAEVAWVRPDGGVGLLVTRPERARRTEALVQCPPWASPDVESPALKQLYHAMVQERAPRGIFVTPGAFSEEARQFAALRPLELIDGAGLLRTISRMSAGEQEYHLKLATVGSYTVPACPACSRKLVQRDDAIPGTGTGDCVKDLTLRGRQMLGDEISCRTLTVKPGAEIQFMRPVYAHEMIVRGRAAGNMTVQGRLTVGAGGVLSGLVAARSIKLDEGGVLEAEARILNAGHVEPVRPLPTLRIWRCPDWPKCRGQLPVR